MPIVYRVQRKFMKELQNHKKTVLITAKIEV